MTEDVSPWADALAAAALLAIDPARLGGAVLRGGPGLARDAWLARLRTLLPPEAPVRRLPSHAGEDRLLGGLDLTATLRAGRPIAERGLLAEADGGVLVAVGAERMPPGIAAQLAIARDTGEVALERHGIALRAPARLAVVALDDGATPDEAPSPALRDRLAFHLDLASVAPTEQADPTAASVAAARARLRSVAVPDALLEALCAATVALGIASPRAGLFALAATAAAAALAGRTVATEADAALAARLVLAPRATTLPAPPPDAEEPSPEPAPPPEDAGGAEREDSDAADRPLQDVVLAAAQAAIPPALLAQLATPAAARARTPGCAGATQPATRRGRPLGARPGDPRRARLNLIETLRAAAPWQALRRHEAPEAPARVLVRPADFRVTRFRERRQTTTLFVVDASGSAALHRLAEAKGAVELLLAECYVRRDRVALLAFRGRGAELLLPPTSSLVRAKRALAGLPGGGGTPLPAAIEAAATLADGIARRGDTPVLVFLTDGRGNIARDGTADRPRAAEEALAASRALRALRLAALLVDTAPRPSAQARALAEAMGARYLPLPHADAAALSRAIRTGAVR